MGTYCINSDELYHHGVLGMRWGIRRYQPYGTAYDAENKGKFIGKKPTSNHESSDSQNGSRSVDATSTKKVKKQSAYNKRIMDSYKRYGMTDEEAAAALEKRKKLVKGLAIAAGVTMAVAGGYLAYRNIRGGYLDVKIPKNVMLQTLSDIDNKMSITDDNVDFYTSFVKSDTNTYKAIFGFKGKAPKQMHTAKVAETMNIASTKNATKAFKGMMENDSSFRNRVANEMPVKFGAGRKGPVHFGGDESINKLAAKIQSGKQLTDREYSQLYKKFNLSFVDNTPEGKSLKKSFYETLKKQGYDGVIDWNDKNGYGLKAKLPSIIFDDSKIGGRTTRAITEADRNNALVKEGLRQIGFATMNNPQTYLGLGIIPIAAASSYDNKVKTKAQMKKRANERAQREGTKT